MMTIDTNKDGIVNDKDEKNHELVKRVIASQVMCFILKSSNKLQLVVNDEEINEDYLIAGWVYDNSNLSIYLRGINVVRVSLARFQKVIIF